MIDSMMIGWHHFNVPSVSGVERLDQVCISRRADPGFFVANRAVILQRGKLTIRAAQFKPAESLPPPPTRTTITMSIHWYSVDQTLQMYPCRNSPSQSYQCGSIYFYLPDSC
jgi:hypothetical protein